MAQNGNIYLKSIHATFSEPRKHLLQIVLEFITMAVEAAHFPDATRALVPVASGRSVRDFSPKFSLRGVKRLHCNACTTSRMRRG